MSESSKQPKGLHSSPLSFRQMLDLHIVKQLSERILWLHGFCFRRRRLIRRGQHKRVQWHWKDHSSTTDVKGGMRGRQRRHHRALLTLEEIVHQLNLKVLCRTVSYDFTRRPQNNPAGETAARQRRLDLSIFLGPRW